MLIKREHLEGIKAGRISLAFRRWRPWTIQVLRSIGIHPGRPASELAAAICAEKDWLKLNIRKLKALGLTESLSVGYRLSPRGKVVLRSIEGEQNRAGQHR
jgi:hypothetical protein